jgi:Outer membrane protein beta-barrel domain
MKIIVFLVIFSCSACVVHAEVRFGPELGFNGSLYTGTLWSSSLKGGVRTGIMANVHLKGQFFLQPGVLYVGNGYLPPLQSGGSSIKMNIHTLEVPINVVYKMKSIGSSTPYFAAGPYLAMNVGGTVTTAAGIIYSNPPDDGTRHIRTGSGSTDDIKLWDFGMGSSFGIQFDRGFYTRFFFHKGFANLVQKGDAGNTMKNFNLGLCIGYYFGCRAVKKVDPAKK